MNGIRALLTLRPTIPSRAGSNVTAASIVIATINAEAQPIVVIIGTPGP